MTVMLVGGLWHGASWNFVIWGGIHGLMLSAERLCRRWKSRWPVAVRVALTFGVVNLGWVFFRSETLPQAANLFASLFGLSHVAGGAECLAVLVYTPYHLAMFTACSLLVWGAPQAWTFTQRLTPVRAGGCLALLALSLVFLWCQTVNPFLYFRF